MKSAAAARIVSQPTAAIWWSCGLAATRFKGYAGVLVQIQRDSENTWTDHEVKTNNAFVEMRTPAEPNKPEVRRYQQIYVKNDQPVELWSDVVSETVEP